MAEQKKPAKVKIRITAKRPIFGPDGAMAPEGESIDGKEDGKKSNGIYQVSEAVANHFIKRKEAVAV